MFKSSARVKGHLRHAADAEPVPDGWQIGAMTLLLALAALPLLLELRPQVGGFIGLLLALRIAALRWPRLQAGTWALVGLMLLGGLNVVDTYDGFAGKEPGTALLLTMIMLKLLEVRRQRDLRVLATVLGFLLIVLFLFSTSAWMAGLVALLLLGNLALLCDLGTAGADLQARLRPALRSAGLLTLQAAPLAVALFLFFPRLDAPLWNLGLDSDVARTGLKNWLEPGSVGELVIDGGDAFRVRFDEPLPVPVEALYWRGPVLWRTNGRRWMPAPAYGAATSDAEVVLVGKPLNYWVLLEPTDQHWLLALDMPIAIPSDATLTGDFQVRTARPVKDLRMYRMTSTLQYRTTGLSPAEQQAGLRLPDNITPRMRELVGRWTAGDAAPKQVVQRALDHFNDEPYRYTLLPPLLGDNPADAFLFETRSGFCEHYASSFVLLMRIAGIPARIVAGYLGGEYNPISSDYIVRQSDAHAWTEVWLEGRGWVRVDPTAAIAPERVDRDPRVSGLGASAPVRFRVDADSGLGRLVHGLRLLADAVDAGWTNWVVGFSSLRQRQMLEGLGLGHLRQYGLALLMAAAGIAIMALWSLFIGRPQPPADPAVRAWEHLSRKLARIGLSRDPAEGPRDYRNRVIKARPDLAADLDPILTAYLRLRYRRDTGPADLGELKRRIRRLQPRRASRPVGSVDDPNGRHRT